MDWLSLPRASERVFGWDEIPLCFIIFNYDTIPYQSNPRLSGRTHAIVTL